ncbi:MAG: hypothetical protein ACKVOR_01595 [Flavobacteriales bacterium]
MPIPPPPTCNPAQPLIQLDPNGQAPVLSYNIPQSTSFDSVGYVEIGIDPSEWVIRPQYPLTLFKRIENLTKPEISKIIQQELNGRANNCVIQGPESVVANSSYSVQKKSFANTYKMLDPNTYTPTGEQEVYIYGVPLSEIVDMVAAGYRPIVYRNLYGKTKIRFIKEPVNPDPSIYLVLHYKTSSYTGDYGAGKVIKTFSLLPGEKTTISITTFNHNEETRKYSENVIDSFSESSSEDLENIIESQKTVDEQSSESKVKNRAGHVGLKFPIGKKIEANAGVSASNTNTVGSSIATHTSMLDRSVSHQASQTSSKRDININTEVNSTNINETTQSTVRELKNINLSRTLNFVFRQMLQEFKTVTYLDRVSLLFADGIEEHNETAELHDIDGFLNRHVAPTRVESVRNFILQHLASIADHTGVPTSFIECYNENISSYCDLGLSPYTNTYPIKLRNLSQTWEGITVPGIILNVNKRVLRTDAIVVDSFLGQGEALDCYNMKLQDAAASNAYLENEKLQQAMAIIESITDPAQKATLYKKVFTECCDVPQSGCGCNDSNNPQ